MKIAALNPLMKKYAKAYLALFGDALSIKDIEKFAQVAQFLHDHSQILFFLRLPALDTRSKIDGIMQVCEQFDLPSNVQTLIVLLARHKRLSFIADIMDAISMVYMDFHAIMPFIIKSSHDLTNKDQEIIMQFLAHQTQCDIIYTYVHDPSLIAGIRLQSDTILWEHSVRKQLNNMQLPLIR